MVFSLREIYGHGLAMTTAEQTIPEDAENNLYKEQTADGVEGVREYVPTNRIWTTLIVIVGFIILLQVVDKEL